MRKKILNEREREREIWWSGDCKQPSHRSHLSKVREPPYHLTSSTKDQANNAGNLEWYTPTIEEP